MTDEEKEAIKELESCRTFWEERLNKPNLSEDDIKETYEEIEQITIILNLIEKQQKEIEGLKRLLYRNELSQYGKRKLINYYEQQEKDYKRVLKENENLKSENSRLKVIRYSREYGTENIYLITKSDLVQIDINKYMIEIEDGKFVDLKQIYQENKELEKENEKLNKLHIQDNKHLDFIMKHSVPVQKVKDKIEELDYKDIGNFERRCKQEVLQSLLEKE